MENEQLDRLANQFRSGDQESLRYLVDTLSRTLIALAYRYTHDWETARDLTQETWLKVYTSIKRYDPNQPFRRWLLVIHRNSCLSYLRKAAVQREMTTADETLQQLAPAIAVQDPLADLERQEFGARLDRALTYLSESQRRVFACVDLERMGQAEAARYLGMKFTTLRTTLHFARRKLAGILRGLEEVT
jgi:RNA polymerase sigma-70 factor (ECF subfamily)